MKQLFYIGILLPIFFVTRSFGQQQIEPIINSTLSGKVVDSRTQLALEGAVIRIKGTTHEVLSDKEGKYDFRTGQKFPYIVVVTHVGYQPLEATIHTAYTNLALVESPLNLDEVVLTGYNKQDKKTLTSAVSSIGIEKIRNVPAAS